MTEIPFDPFDLLPERTQMTQERYDAIVQYFLDNGAAPSGAALEAIVGVDIPTPAYTDPLPDGFAGQKWDNPRWLKRLVARQE